jgi:UDP-GlcNAc:undecaprenyl-phosphate GlcNAc-1-phosphate transferase
VSFPFNAYLLAFGGAFAITLISLPLWRKWCVKTGLVDNPGHRKIHDQPIPLAGGLAVATGLLLPVSLGATAIFIAASTLGGGTRIPLLGGHAGELLAYGLERRGLELAAIAFGALGMLFLGWWDDRHELKAAPKFACQFTIAALVAIAGVRITLFVPSDIFSYAVTILWILTLTNAFNFMDNMNGLCSGLGAIAAGHFALAAAARGQYLVAMLAFLICGALAGFLPHNFPKASAFLGDSGSHLVGFLLAVLAILPHFYTRKQSSQAAVLSPLLILAVPLFDLVSVVLIRWRNGQPFYIGDNNHLSHRLVRQGFSKPKAVLLLWLAALIFGAMAHWL